MSALKRVVLHAGILSLGIVGARILNLCFRWIAAFNLDVEGYGRMAMALSLINYGSILATFNMGGALARFLGVVNHEDRHALIARVRRAMFWSSCLSCAGIMLFAWHLRYGPGVIACIAIGVIVFALCNVSEGILRAYDLSGYQAINQVSISGARLLLLGGIVLLLGTTNLAEICVYIFVAGLVVGMVYAGGKAREALRSPGPGRSPDDGGDEATVWRFGAMLTVANLMTWGVGLGNRFLLQRYGTFADVAHYDNALLFYSFFQNVLASFVMVSVPYYARQGPGGVYRVIPVLKVTSLFLGTYLLLAGVYALGWVDSIFRLAGIPEYQTFYPVFLVVSLAFPAEFIFLSISAIWQGRNEIMIVTLVTILGGGISLAVGLGLVPRFGTVGSAVSSLSYWLVLATCAVVMARRRRLPLVAG